VIKSQKNNKTPGPDGLRAELTKWLNKETSHILLNLYDAAFRSNTYYPSLGKANIVQINKKGDATNMDNYRPISLLQTAYNIPAAMMKHRLSKGLDAWITDTQYGFGPNRSTSHAIFMARRLQDMAERKGGNLTIGLLDWGPTKDDTGPQKAGYPRTHVKLLENIYKQPKFVVNAAE
jgi:hypothetical protein